MLDADAWPGFLRSLPEMHRRALDPGKQPRVAMVHPHESLVWTPYAPSWNQLVDVAAGVLTQNSRLTETAHLPAWVGFRRIWARAWNPFLPTRDRGQISADMGLSTGFARLRAHDVAIRHLDSLAEGESVAAALHRHPSLDRSAMRTLMREGRHAFIWHLGVSTIRSSPLSA